MCLVEHRVEQWVRHESVAGAVAGVVVSLCDTRGCTAAILRPRPPRQYRVYLQAFKYVGTEIAWVGEGVDEYGHVKGDTDNVVVRVDPRYFRPTEVELLLVSTVVLSCTIIYYQG